MAAAATRTGVNSIWILPSAMTFVAFYKNIFEFGNFVVALCRTWLDFCRELWSRLFALAPDGAAPGMSAASSDMLTLWVTCSLAVWLFPMLTRDQSGQPKTTVAALTDFLPLPALGIRLLAFVLIGFSALVIALPFAAPPAPGDASLVDVLQESQVIGAGGFGAWLAQEGVWVAFAMLGVAIAVLTYVFFVVGPRLAAAVLSEAEKRDLIILAAVLWFASAAFLVASLVLPAGGALITREDAMVLSLTALIGLVAWRSALPFVQLAGLIVAIFTIDAVYRFVLDVWTSVQG
ncbi:MAG: hypothetical protein JNJ63_01970 [Hyphomonadaceae bacterium]|nr:hypothetical protein [Hyphomonadaceae bacterium]